MNEHNEEKEFDPFESSLDDDAGRSRRRGAGIAWLALLIALAAAGSSAYRWWVEWQDDAADREQRQRQQALQREDEELRQSLQALSERLGSVEKSADGERIATLQGSVDTLERRLEGLDQGIAKAQASGQATQAALFELQQSFESLEATTAALAARSDTPAQRFELHEVESLLRLAAERLQLFGDVGAADRALALADERLAAMDEPVYLSVRQRIGRARQALDEIDAPDLVQLDARLAALQSSIGRWPLEGAEAAPNPAGESAEGAGLWDRIKHTLAGLVTVRRRAPDAELTIADQEYLRQGLWMQFETARLALMRGSGEIYGRALDRAANTLRDRFAEDASAIQVALSEIEALRKVELDRELPDISGPWSQFQLLRQRGTESPQAGGPAVTGEAGSGEGDDPAAAIAAPESVQGEGGGE